MRGKNKEAIFRNHLPQHTTASSFMNTTNVDGLHLLPKFLRESNESERATHEHSSALHTEELIYSHVITLSGFHLFGRLKDSL